MAFPVTTMVSIKISVCCNSNLRSHEFQRVLGHMEEVEGMQYSGNDANIALKYEILKNKINRKYDFLGKEHLNYIPVQPHIGSLYPEHPTTSQRSSQKREGKNWKSKGLCSTGVQVEDYLLDVAGLLHSGTHLDCGCLHKINPVPFQHGRKRGS